jgi:hypothetical protein
LRDDEAQPPERLVILRMSAVRYLTKVSGFLNIHSNERKRYKEFDPNYFVIPNEDWKAPYPYCPEDVLFPVEHQELENQILQELPQSRSVAALEEHLWSAYRQRQPGR